MYRLSLAIDELSSSADVSLLTHACAQSLRQ
jgi:hypothetical protein